MRCRYLQIFLEVPKQLPQQILLLSLLRFSLTLSMNWLQESYLLLPEHPTVYEVVQINAEQLDKACIQYIDFPGRGDIFVLDNQRC